MTFWKVHPPQKVAQSHLLGFSVLCYMNPSVSARVELERVFFSSVPPHFLPKYILRYILECRVSILCCWFQICCPANKSSIGPWMLSNTNYTPCINPSLHFLANISLGCSYWRCICYAAVVISTIPMAALTFVIYSDKYCNVEQQQQQWWRWKTATQNL